MALRAFALEQAEATACSARRRVLVTYFDMVTDPQKHDSAALPDAELLPQVFGDRDLTLAGDRGGLQVISWYYLVLPGKTGMPLKTSLRQRSQPRLMRCLPVKFSCLEQTPALLLEHPWAQRRARSRSAQPSNLHTIIRWWSVREARARIVRNMHPAQRCDRSAALKPNRPGKLWAARA